MKIIKLLGWLNNYIVYLIVRYLLLSLITFIIYMISSNKKEYRTFLSIFPNNVSTHLLLEYFKTKLYRAEWLLNFCDVCLRDNLCLKM